jgi:shikimate kinase
MIISLIGFMGCGKSSVGRRLSQLLCCPFIDLDDVIEEREGRTIAEIFAAEGEAGFREIELESLLTVVEGGCSKTESLPRLRRGPLPFTRPRTATVFESSTLHNAQTDQHCHTEGSEGSSYLILALGGGTVMTPQCAALVMENTLCIYLKASVDTLMERLAPDNESRPLLCPYASPSMQGEETSPAEDLLLRNRIEHLLSQRSAIYEKTANIIIDTDGKSIDQICSEILGLNH